MSSRIETPEETLARLNAEQQAEVTPSPRDVDRPAVERRHEGRRSRDPYPRIRVLLTVIVGLAALGIGGLQLFHAAEMTRFGEAVTAEVVGVEHHSRGGSDVAVVYVADGVGYAGTVHDFWGAPTGASTEIIYDTRDATHITDAPLTSDYVLGLLGLGFGTYLLVWTVRDVRRRRGSQWLPD